MTVFDFLRKLGGFGSGTASSSSSRKNHWSPDRAAKHTKLAHSERVQRQWAKVGQQVHAKTGDVGAGVRAANSTVRKTVSNDVGRTISRDATQKSEFLKQQGYTNCKPPKGFHVDHKEALCVGGKDRPSNMQLLSKSQHCAKTRDDMLKLRDLKARVIAKGKRK